MYWQSASLKNPCTFSGAAVSDSNAIVRSLFDSALVLRVFRFAWRFTYDGTSSGGFRFVEYGGRIWIHACPSSNSFLRYSPASSAAWTPRSVRYEIHRPPPSPGICRKNWQSRFASAVPSRAIQWMRPSLPIAGSMSRRNTCAVDPTSGVSPHLP